MIRKKLILFSIIIAFLPVYSLSETKVEIATNKVEEHKNKSIILPKTTTEKGMSVPILTKQSEVFSVEHFLEYQVDFQKLPNHETAHIKNFVEITPESLIALTVEKKESLGIDYLKAYRSRAARSTVEFGYGEYRIFMWRNCDQLTYFSSIRHDGSCLEVEKIYHNNLKIKSKHLVFPGPLLGGVRVGVGYEFDENGVFVKEKNYCEDYKFTHLDVIKYCQEEGIPLYTPATRSRSNVTKLVKSGKNVWNILYRDYESTSGILEIEKVLDGETGKLLETKTRKLKHN